jgi:hypothetical protein
VWGGGQKEQHGGGAGVRSPTSSASGEAVEPKIETETKIGTYKSAELGLKPAAWSFWTWVGPPLSPSFS